MVPSITHRQLKNVVFPVFRLPKEDITYRDGLLMYRNLVIDDKNEKGDTLGKRRLTTPHKLFRLKRPYIDIVEIINSKHLYFIDAKGRAFRYNKTEFTFVKFHKIKSIEGRGKASILWAYGIATPFQIKRPPKGGPSWVGILYYKGYPWRIFEYSDEKKPTYRKKI